MKQEKTPITNRSSSYRVQEKYPQKLPGSSKNYLKTTLMILGAVLILGSAVFAISKILSSKSEGDKFTIGSTTITEKDVNRYVTSMKKYKQSNQDVVFSSNLKQEALDDLVMNAALKEEAKKYNKSLTEAELRKIYGISNSVKDYQKKIETHQNSDSINYYNFIITENLELSKKLQSNLIANRSLFFTSISFDAPAMRSVTDKTKLKQLHDQAKAKLQNEFLPLFEQKLPMETIAAKATVNYTTNKRTGNEYSLIENNPLAVMANYFDHYVDKAVPGQKYAVVNVNTQDNDVRSFKDLENMNYGVTVEDLRDTTAEINKLKNKGDFTPVFASKTGIYMIARLEEKSGGPYGTFQSLLDEYKEKYVPKNFDVSQKKSLKQYVMEKSINLVKKLPIPKVEKVFADYGLPSHCDGHYGTASVGVVNAQNIYQGLAVADVSISQARGSGNNCGTGQSASGRGSASIGINCYSGNVPTTTISNVDSRYVITGGTTSPWDQTVNNTGTWQAYYYALRRPSQTMTPTPTTSTPPPTTGGPQLPTCSMSATMQPEGFAYRVTVQWSSDHNQRQEFIGFAGSGKSGTFSEIVYSTNERRYSATFYNDNFNPPKSVTCTASTSTNTNPTPTPTPGPVYFQPYTRIYGNDVIVGSAFREDDGSCSTNQNAQIKAHAGSEYAGNYPNRTQLNYGASAQFAVFEIAPGADQSSGGISGFFSNNLRSYASSPPGDGFTQSFGTGRSNDFTFGNYWTRFDEERGGRKIIAGGRVPTWGGNSGILHCLPNFYKEVVDKGTVPISGNTVINIPDPIPKGQRRLIVVDGDAYINSNIEYAGTNSWANVSEIPNLTVIVKGNISIDPSVTRLDGIFIAQPRPGNQKGEIFTCGDASGSVPLDQVVARCRNKLTVNGSFVSKKTVFRRANGFLTCPRFEGSDTLLDPSICEEGEHAPINEPAGSNNIAEVINFSPEAYLTPLNSSLETNLPFQKYDSIKSLPPVL